MPEAKALEAEVSVCVTSQEEDRLSCEFATRRRPLRAQTQTPRRKEHSVAGRKPREPTKDHRNGLGADQEPRPLLVSNRQLCPCASILRERQIRVNFESKVDQGSKEPMQQQRKGKAVLTQVLERVAWVHQIEFAEPARDWRLGAHRIADNKLGAGDKEKEALLSMKSI